MSKTIGKYFVDDIIKKYLKFDTEDGYRLYDRNNDLIDIFDSEKSAREYIEDNEEFLVDTYDSGIPPHRR